MIEKWKDIVGYEGHYQVSNSGRVKRINRIVGTRTDKVLSPFKNDKGYLIVSLYQNGNSKAFLLHRLVLKAFVGQSPSPKSITRHLDGDQKNNRLDNLTWGTYSENMQDSLKHGTHVCGSKHKMSKLTERDVKQIIKLLQGNQTQTEIGNMFGVSHRTISYIKLNKTWRHIQR